MTPGLLLTVVIFARIVFLALPFPASSVLGQGFCYWINIPALMSVCGCYIWSCCIAFVRFLFIRVQKCFATRCKYYKTFFVLICEFLYLTLVFVRIGWKSLPLTNTLGYYNYSYITDKTFFTTLGQVPVKKLFCP
jgi:hypothetical protein